MKTQSISNSLNFNGKYVVPIKENSNIKLLTNYLCDLTKAQQLTASFSKDEVVLSTVNNTQDLAVQKTLKDICANYILDGKKVINKAKAKFTVVNYSIID